MYLASAPRRVCTSGSFPSAYRNRAAVAAGLLRDCVVGLVILLPDDDYREGEQDGVDNPDGREFESGDLIVLDKSLDTDRANE